MIGSATVFFDKWRWEDRQLTGKAYFVNRPTSYWPVGSLMDLPYLSYRLSTYCMKIASIYYCRECRVSHHRRIKNLKNAFIENPRNLRGAVSSREIGILEDYSHKNIIKKPEHLVSLSRMATEISKEWKNGRRLTVSFLGGKKEVKDRIIRHAKIWMEYANIEFDFRQRKKPADVRIAFDSEMRPSQDLLRPLGEVAPRWPELKQLVKGAMDLRSALDTEDARRLKQAVATLPPARVKVFQEELSLASLYTHGTHVAGDRKSVV